MNIHKVSELSWIFQGWMCKSSGKCKASFSSIGLEIKKKIVAKYAEETMAIDILSANLVRMSVIIDRASAQTQLFDASYDEI